MQQTEDFLSRSPDAFFPEALVEEHLQEDEALKKALIANSSQVLGNRLQVLKVLSPDAFIRVITFLHHSTEVWLLISTHMLLEMYKYFKLLVMGACFDSAGMENMQHFLRQARMWTALEAPFVSGMKIVIAKSLMVESIIPAFLHRRFGPPLHLRTILYFRYCSIYIRICENVHILRVT